MKLPKLIFSLVLIALLTISLSLHAQASKWSADLGIWHPSVRGSGFTYGNYSLDLSNDLNISDTTSPYLRLRYQLNKRWDLGLEYFYLSYNGYRNITTSVTFPYTTGGYTHIVVTGAFNVNSSLKHWSLDGNAIYKVSSGRTGDLGLMIGVRYLNFKVTGQFSGTFNVDFYNGNTLLGSSAGRTFLNSEYTVEAPVPYLGITGNLKLSKNFTANLTYRGMSYSGSSTTASFSDLEIALNWKFSDKLSLNIGYKDQELNYRDSDGRNGNLSFRGPVLTLTWNF